MKPLKNPNPDIRLILSMARGNASITSMAHASGASKKQVAKILAEHGITPAESKYNPKKNKLATDEHGKYFEPADKPPPMKDSPTETARRVWGKRLTERDGDYHLDGMRIGFASLMQKTNRRLLEFGMEQVEGSPAWRV